MQLDTNLDDDNTNNIANTTVIKERSLIEYFTLDTLRALSNTINNSTEAVMRAAMVTSIQSVMRGAMRNLQQISQIFQLATIVTIFILMYDFFSEKQMIHNWKVFIVHSFLTAVMVVYFLTDVITTAVQNFLNFVYSSSKYMVLFGLFFLLNKNRIDPILEVFGSIMMTFGITFIISLWKKDLKEFNITKEAVNIISILLTFLITGNKRNLFYSLVGTQYEYLIDSQYSTGDLEKFLNDYQHLPPAKCLLRYLATCREWRITAEHYFKAEKFFRDHPVFEHLKNLGGYLLGLQPYLPSNSVVESNNAVSTFSRVTSFLGAHLGSKGHTAQKSEVMPWESKLPE